MVARSRTTRLSKRIFLLLSMTMVGCLLPANANVIEYEPAGDPLKHANVIVPAESKTAFIEVLRSFGVDYRFETLIVPGPNKDQVAIQLSSESLLLIADNPFSDAKEYHIALYQNENKSIAEWEVDKYWSELKHKIVAVNGVEDWLDKNES